jgi:hypothetical protein
MIIEHLILTNLPEIINLMIDKGDVKNNSLPKNFKQLWKRRKEIFKR